MSIDAPGGREVPTIEAIVDGNRPYEVRLTSEETTILARCDCPFVRLRGLPCKHIWATVLAAEAEERLDLSRSGLSLTLDPELTADGDDDPVPSSAAPEREVFYRVDVGQTLTAGRLVLDVLQRRRRLDGDWGNVRTDAVKLRELPHFSDALDRKVLRLLADNARVSKGRRGWYPPPHAVPPMTRMSIDLAEVLLPMVCETGRARLRRDGDAPEGVPLTWDAGPPWELWLEVRRDAAEDCYVVDASLRREEERLTLEQPDLIVGGGFLFVNGSAALLEDFGAFHWIAEVRRSGPVRVPQKDEREFLTQLLESERRPRLDLPSELRYETVDVVPRPRLQIYRLSGHRNFQLRAELSFEYDSEFISSSSSASFVVHRTQRSLVRRDRVAEAAARSRLEALGLRRLNERDVHGFRVATAGLPELIRALIDEGWLVEAEGRAYRLAGSSDLSVRSGVDWFELRGGARFDDQFVAIPELLEAVRRGDNMVRLDDGTVGLLPEEWLRRFEPLASLGRPDDDHIRFGASQVGLLDALLARQPDIRVDEVFERARERLASFERIEPAAEPPGFVGKLREYQREGLGWLLFLRRFGFGGCLADDMGLGKTIQVLALLQHRKRVDPPEIARPTLIVVPRSLVFNWVREAERFTPELRVLDHTGAARTDDETEFEGFDLVLTTYGTLRRDAPVLSKIRFDYAILDESQMIKNPSTQVAKAARLIRADHRLALSGTPVENHLGELWSLFEFINPGILGAARVFKRMTKARREIDDETREVLARSLRPFILRRTKAEVAKDLPTKTEQTLLCDLTPEQRRLYDELRNHYRFQLSTNIEKDGIGKSKMKILEALLRLRQTACHPGLVDNARRGDPSGKLDLLLPQLEEVIDEGHKALVFSQFTSLLSIVRERLDAAGTRYCYLDGKTRDREAEVQRFQESPDHSVFLISLRAGGLGLNLTVAEYVFLLDPWWNPAIETQAIDRTHRIGQTRQVFAYRLVARDTVEEKILELQQAKRELADAIIEADGNLLSTLDRDDLERLLS